MKWHPDLILYWTYFQKDTGLYVDLDMREVEFENIPLTDESRFVFIKGLNKYIRRYIDKNPGKIPVLGSSLDNDCISSHVVPISEKDVIKDIAVTFNKQ